MKKFMPKRLVLVAMAGLIGLIAEDDPQHFYGGQFLSQAHAEVGRPRTPRSAAGVARRTTRRVVRRTTDYIKVLPADCEVVVVDGVSLHSCSGVYYEAYGGQYVVVVVE